MTTDPERELVRRGYDAISYLYRGDDTAEGDISAVQIEHARRLVPAGMLLARRGRMLARSG
jgi:hypothetical protein